MNTLRLLVAALCLLCVKSETLTQPGSVTVQPGRTLSVSCRVSYSAGTATTWIRQSAGKALEWIGYHCSGCNGALKDSLKNKFNINVDSSSKTFTLTGQNMQPVDSGVYYCARTHSGGTYFDHWGRGTTVTVTSVTPQAPKVFPVMPCDSDSAEITLACLATGFTPSTVTFSWTRNGTTVSDFLQFPSVQQNELFSGVSQIRIRRQDWDERHIYKCKVEHPNGIREVDFVRPVEIYELPSLKVMTTEDDRKVTLSCLANNFVPNVYEFKWLKNELEITDTSLMFNTPSQSQKSSNGTRYTAASFLTLPADELRDDTRLKCKFNLGRGRRQTTVNDTYQYKPNNPCSGGGPVSSAYSMVITPPSLEDLLYQREGKLRCEVRVTDQSKMRNVYWMNGDREVLMNVKDPGAVARGGHYTLDLDITYEEWNRGIKRICLLEHDDLITGHSQEYVRKNDPDFVVDMIEVYHRWNEEQVQEEDSMQNTALAFILLFLITLLFCIGTTAFKVK